MQNQFSKIIAGVMAFMLPTMTWAMDNPAQLTVLEGWRQADGSHIAAIRLDLDKGWKTYWRAPGDAGIPPYFDLLGSSNIVDFNVDWPAPVVFDQSGLWSVGYKDMVIFPMHITPRKPNRDIRLKGAIEVGICKDICVPISLDIDAVLAADVTQKDATISAALVSVPYTRDEADVKKATCKLKNDVGDLGVTAEIEMPA
ncbi:MAG: protein-disulfide reductase DsbD family protein, partial [Paracoccaceae bacterium]|nr:protein-disulfide reductase DsbD family protein [Paracoccaceae bacterium]